MLQIRSARWYTLADVLSTAHRIRVAVGDYNINDAHLADAIAELAQRKTPAMIPE